MGSMTGRGPLGRWMHRLTASNDELLADARRLAAAQCGAVAAQTCSDRQKVVLNGTITAMTVPPTDAVRVEADLDDGSGRVKLIWMGRREIGGIRPGTVLRVSGRLSCRDDEKVIFNPGYEIVSIPA